MLANRYRWRVASIMFCGSALGYIDRTAIGVLGPLIVKDLHLTAGQLGLALGAFSVGYTILCLIGGYISDRLFGPHRVLLYSMLLWSLFCGLTAVSTGLVSLIVIRLLFGMGEGAWSPVLNKLVSRWFPRSEQASAIGFANAGQPLGAALCGPIVGMTASIYNWRTSFVVVALLGMIWTVAWKFFVSERPEDNPRVGYEERHLIQTKRQLDVSESDSRQSLGKTLVSVRVLAIMLGCFSYMYMTFFILSWFPSYLVSARHLSVEHMAFVSALPWTVGFLGHSSGGFISDKIYRRTGDSVGARKWVMCTCTTLTALCVMAGYYATTVPAAVLLMSLGVFFLALTPHTFWALILDTTEAEKVGGVSGFILGLASTGAIFSPVMTGYLVETTASFVTAFILAGVVSLAGALIVFLFVRRRPDAPAGIALPSVSR
ncbi:MFS transporter [Burkholderia sp. WAC0059]|uniref:MFS transporter n=1 Tax=Burkholderia sp. WAC0059 TaxID=2066022 RepID=UPI0015E0754A|nr:MFS transporter [Burkholderia sp. WAC0059]